MNRYVVHYCEPRKFWFSKIHSKVITADDYKKALNSMITYCFKVKPDSVLYTREHITPFQVLYTAHCNVNGRDVCLTTDKFFDSVKEAEKEVLMEEKGNE